MTTSAFHADASWMAAIGQHLTPTQANAISVVGPPGYLTAVPLDDLGRRYLRHNVYIRSTKLGGQFRPDTTHLGYSVSGHLVAVPILRWWLIGSYQAIPSTGVARLAAIMAEPDLHDNWPRFAALLELGGPVAASMRLGYAPPKNATQPRLPGIVNRPMAEVVEAADDGRTFQSLTKLQKRADDTDRFADQARPANRYGYARVSPCTTPATSGALPPVPNTNAVARRPTPAGSAPRS